MFLFVTTLIFMFISKLRFPKKVSIVTFSSDVFFVVLITAHFSIQSHNVSPQEVLSNLQCQVEAGAVLYIETNGVGCYADPRFPPSRSGKMMGRKPTKQSKTGDLVGKVVMAVREIVEHKQAKYNKKTSARAAQSSSSALVKPCSQFSCLGPDSKLSPNGNNNRNVMASMRDILLHLQKSSSFVLREDNDESQSQNSQDITPSLLKAAVKRAVMRGFLNEAGKYYSIDNSKDLPVNGRRRRKINDPQSINEISHLLVEDDESSDSCAENESFLSSSLGTIASPSLISNTTTTHSIQQHSSPLHSPSSRITPNKNSSTSLSTLSPSKFSNSSPSKQKTPHKRNIMQELKVSSIKF